MIRISQLVFSLFSSPTLLALLLATWLAGCCCNKEQRGQSVPIPDNPAHGAQQPAHADGIPPTVYGKARFDANLVHVDLKLAESASPSTARIDLRWMSHSGGHTPPLPWPVGGPQDSYTNNPPTQRWYVYSIPATCDRTKDCFHLQISAYKEDGTLLGTLHKSFQPMSDTDWESPLPVEP